MNKESNNTYFEYTKHSACRDAIEWHLIVVVLCDLLSVIGILILKEEFFWLPFIVITIVSVLSIIQDHPKFHADYPILYIDPDILKIYVEKKGHYIPHTFDLDQIDYIEIGYKVERYLKNVRTTESSFSVIMKNGYKFQCEIYKLMGTRIESTYRIQEAIEHYTKRKDIVHYKEMKK